MKQDEVLTQDQIQKASLDEQNRLMAMPRSERRRYGKAVGVMIPASNAPFVKVK